MKYLQLLALVVILSGCATEQEKYEADKHHCVMYYNIDDTPENKMALERCVYQLRYNRGDMKSTSEKLSEWGNNTQEQGRRMQEDTAKYKTSQQKDSINITQQQIQRKTTCTTRKDPWGNLVTNCN